MNPSARQLDLLAAAITHRQPTWTWRTIWFAEAGDVRYKVVAPAR